MPVKADTSALRQLGKDVRRAAQGAITDARNRAKELLADEAPKGRTRKLSTATTQQEKLSGAFLESRLVLRAVNPNEGGPATLHLPGGGTRTIKLRRGKPFDYAKAVVEGTGLFGPNAQMIEPVRRKALLVGVDAPPAGESYIVGPGGQMFVVRPRSKGQRPNPFHERAADRLEQEVDNIVGDALARENVTP